MELQLLQLLMVQVFRGWEGAGTGRVTAAQFRYFWMERWMQVLNGNYFIFGCFLLNIRTSKCFCSCVLVIWIVTLVSGDNEWNIQGLDAAMLPSHLSTASDWRHIQALSPIIVFFEILKIKRWIVITFRMYDRNSDGTIDFKVYYCRAMT